MNELASDERRRVLLTVASSLLLSGTFWRRVNAAEEFTIDMASSSSGSHVWFRPRGLHIQPGQTVRWVNTDVGNVHTVTAYHPDNRKPQRIPTDTAAWDSGYLLPDAAFTMVFITPGIYDFFCIPHEQAGMVGRIIVGDIDAVEPYGKTDSLLPEKALSGFPAVTTILEHGRVD